MGFTQYIEKMDIAKLLNCDISVGKPDKTFSSIQINQIEVSEMCVCSHNHISMMTKSFSNSFNMFANSTFQDLSSCHKYMVSKSFTNCGFYMIFIQKSGALAKTLRHVGVC